MPQNRPDCESSFGHHVPEVQWGSRWLVNLGLILHFRMHQSHILQTCRRVWEWIESHHHQSLNNSSLKASSGVYGLSLTWYCNLQYTLWAHGSNCKSSALGTAMSYLQGSREAEATKVSLRW
jgi:hypothetical protein